MKAMRWMMPLSAAITLLMSASGSVSAREEEKDVQVYDTSDHPRLSLRNINGGLTVEGWNKNRIEVTVVKRASSKERLEDIKIESRMDNDHLRIEVDLEDDGNWSTRGESLNVEFTIRVPHGTRVDSVELVNGDIDIRNIDGDVEVSSVNGEVSGEQLGGDVQLATVNGEVSLIATGDAESISMNSVNGGVVLVLPRKFDARIQAGTVHGSIRANGGFDVDATTFSGSSMNATIGKGGMKVDLNTVNGSIEIRREGEGGTKDRK